MCGSIIISVILITFAIQYRLQLYMKLSKPDCFLGPIAVMHTELGGCVLLPPWKMYNDFEKNKTKKHLTDTCWNPQSPGANSISSWLQKGERSPMIWLDSDSVQPLAARMFASLVRKYLAPPFFQREPLKSADDEYRPNPETTELAMMTNVTPGRTCGATIPHCHCVASPTRTLSEFYHGSSLFCSLSVIQYLWLCRNIVDAPSLFPYVTRTICSKLAGQAKVKAPERRRGKKKPTGHKCGMHSLFFCFGKHYLFGKFICSLIPFHLPMTYPGHHAPFFFKFINNFGPSKNKSTQKENCMNKGEITRKGLLALALGTFFQSLWPIRGGKIGKTELGPMDSWWLCTHKQHITP